MEVRIESLAGGGAGIAKEDGKVYFVTGGVPGDLLEIKVIKDKGRFAEAVIKNILEPSEDRVEPQCEVYSRCGGCELQHLNYSSQLIQKENILRETLRRIGGFNEIDIEPVTPSKEYGYRNRVTLSAFFYSGAWHVGYNQKRSNRKVKIEGCPVSDSIIEAAIGRLSAVLSSISDPSYSLDKLHISSNGEASYITLVTKEGRKPDTLNVLIKHLKRYEETENVAVLGQREEEFIYKSSGFSFITKPTVFSQANYEINEAMVKTVIEWAGSDGSDQLLDLYSGAGNFSIPLSKKVKSVDAVELNRSSVSLARKNAKFNGADNITFHNLSSEEFLTKAAQDKKKYDTVILDPPREGAKGCIEGIKKVSPSKIIYISCDPATLARDLKGLSELGYELKAVRPFDMFPETSHIESVSLVTGV